MDAPAPLTPEQIRAIADGRHRATKIRRAATVAAISGWSLIVFAALTALGVLFGSITALVMALALAVLGWNELRGGAMLRRLDPRGPRTLALNQLTLGVVIVAYAAWSLHKALSNPTTLASVGGSTGDPQMDAMIAGVSEMVAWGVYGTMAAVGIIVPGLTAWYYASCARFVHTLLNDTPSWVVQTLRAAA
jgi:hypothetical protein